MNGAAPDATQVQADAADPVAMVPAQGSAMTADLWIGFVVAAVALIAAAGVAWRRSARHEQDPPRRSTRIYRSALTLSLVLNLIYAPYAATRSEGAGQMAINFGAVVAAFLVAGFIMFGLADLLLAPLGPRRNGRWLAVALLLFPALMFGVVLLLSWLMVGFSLEPNPRQLLLECGVVTASLVWWAHLPALAKHAAHVFE